MRSVIYKITYIPHLNSSFPKYYIGSKYNYKGNYFGSVSSTKTFAFTEGKCLKDWWKNLNKSDLLFEVLYEFDDITPQKLVEIESDIQIEFDVLSEEYFNQSLATGKFCAAKNSEETKLKKSIKTKQYWDSELGEAKKERLIERNKLTKSEEMKMLWKTNLIFREKAIKNHRPKGIKEEFPRKERSNVKKVKYKDQIFDSAKKASNILNLPAHTIRYRCKTNYKNEWSYI